MGGGRFGGETTRGGNGLGAKRPGFLLTPRWLDHRMIGHLSEIEFKISISKQVGFPHRETTNN